MIQKMSSLGLSQSAHHLAWMMMAEKRHGSSIVRHLDPRQPRRKLTARARAQGGTRFVDKEDRSPNRGERFTTQCRAQRPSVTRCRVYLSEAAEEKSTTRRARALRKMWRTPHVFVALYAPGFDRSGLATKPNPFAQVGFLPRHGCVCERQSPDSRCREQERAQLAPVTDVAARAPATLSVPFSTLSSLRRVASPNLA